MTPAERPRGLGTRLSSLLSDPLLPDDGGPETGRSGGVQAIIPGAEPSAESETAGAPTGSSHGGGSRPGGARPSSPPPPTTTPHRSPPGSAGPTSTGPAPGPGAGAAPASEQRDAQTSEQPGFEGGESPTGEAAPTEPTSTEAPGGKRAGGRAQLAAADLELLRRAFPVEACALVQRRRSKRAKVRLSASPGAFPSFQQALDFCASLEDSADGWDAGETMTVEGLACLGVPWKTKRRRGLYVLGRRGAPLAGRDAELARQLCSLLSEAGSQS